MYVCLLTGLAGISRLSLHGHYLNQHCRLSQRLAHSSKDALEVAKDVAQQTGHRQLAEVIDGKLVAKWLEGQTEDLDDYERFFHATETSGTSSGSPSPMLEDWLAPLESEPRTDAKVLCRQAQAEGVRIFDLKYDTAAEAAATLRRDGFVALLALGPALLRRQRRLSAELVRRAHRREPRGNRGAQRYSLGRTTMVPGTLELAQSPGVLQVLDAFWGPGCTVQCTGGDASLPGAQRQSLHADVPVKEVADQLYNYYDPQNPERKFMELPTPVVKVYFAMVDMDSEVGPPRFLPGTHELTAKQDVPAVEPPGSIPLICPAGTAIIMDMRVWHGGTANRSNCARPMLSVHYAGPNYHEEVLKDGGSIPFFGTCYWSYHQGAVGPQLLASLSPKGQELCRHLLSDTASVSCAQCHTSQLRPGRNALRSIGAPRGPWLCLNCWARQKASIM